MQLARAIYGDPFFTPYANLALPPIHIIVKNGNVTLEGVVNSTMDRTKAEMAANRYRALLLRREQSSGRERLRDWLNLPHACAVQVQRRQFFLAGAQAMGSSKYN